MAAAADDTRGKDASPRKRLTATRVAYRVVSTLTMVFVVAAAALAIAYIMGLRFYVVMSGSMSPTMPTGSLCVVHESASYDNVKTGDIVAFRTDTGIVTTHRVKAVTSRGLVTKGDANNESDAAPVTKMGYAGRAIWYAPGLGNVVELLLSPVGIGVIVAAIMALLIAELALKRAADIEDSADIELARRDAEIETVNEAVARAAEEAVRATMREYLIYDDVFDTAGGSWSEGVSTSAGVKEPQATPARPPAPEVATPRSAQTSSRPQAASASAYMPEPQDVSVSQVTPSAQFVPTLQVSLEPQMVPVRQAAAAPYELGELYE